MNVPTIIIALIILVVVVLIIGKGIWNKKHHISSCGCNCAGCASKGMCHPETKAHS